MAEAKEQQVSNEQPASTETLDSVYQKYNVEAEAQTFNPQREQKQTTQPVKQAEVPVPDPVLDQNGFKQWAGNQNQFVQTALQSLQGELTQYRVEREAARTEADIKHAVQQFKNVTGEEIDDDMAEVALGQKARKDPRFLSVYNNRSKNPNAWNAAVKAYANEFKGKASFKIDPQIAENQRAAKQSIQGSQSKQADDTENPMEAQLKGKVGREFDNAWRRLVDSGTY